MTSQYSTVEVKATSDAVSDGRSVHCPSCRGTDVIPYLGAPDRYNRRKQVYHLVRCQGCALVWIADPPPADEMGSHYGSEYDEALSTAGESLSRFVWRREQLMRYKQTGTVMDMGCSSGSFLKCMKEAGWDVSGIEMSERTARLARERCGAQVFIGDVLAADFPDESFDAITAFHVLEHMPDPSSVLKRVYRWLKPGGVFYLMIPNIDSAGARVFGSHWFALELPRHLYHFSPTSLRHMAASAGLQEISVTTDREPFIQHSLRYVNDSLLEKLGISRRPLASTSKPSLLRRVFRKVFRLTLLPLLSLLVALAGPGESIHAVFGKPDRS